MATLDPRRSFLGAGVVALTLAAFALRVANLGGPSLGYDEAFDIAAARQGFGALIELLSGREPYPPLHFLSLRGWIALAGTTDFGVRYWSLLFGVALVPLVYQLGRQTLGAGVGLAAAGVAAFNPALLWYAQEIKMYPAVMALTTASTVAAARLLLGPPKAHAGWSWGYVVATIAALYMHYPALFLLAFQWLFALALLLRFGWERVRRWAVLQGIVVLAFLPWIGLAFGLLRGYGSVAPAPADLLHLPSRFLQVFTFGYSDEIVAPFDPLWAAGVALLVIAGSAWSLLVRRDGRGAFAVAGFVVPLLLVSAIALWRPVFAARHLAVIGPMYCLVIGAGIVAIARLRPAVLAAAGGLLVAALIFPSNAAAIWQYYSSPVADRTDNRGVASLVREQWRDGDVLLFVAPYFYPAVLHYLGEGYPHAGLPVAGETEQQTAQRLSDLASQYHRVWLILWQDDAADPAKSVERWLDRHLDRTGVWHPASLAVLRYERGETPDAIRAAPIEGELLAAASPEARFDAGARLRDYRLVDQGQDGLRVDLVWCADRQIEQSLTVFVHLIDGAGERMAQHDGVPRDGRAATVDWLPGECVLDTHRLERTSTGEYRLLVGLYDASTGQRSRLLDATGTAGSDVLEIAPVVLP